MYGLARKSEPVRNHCRRRSDLLQIENEQEAGTTGVASHHQSNCER
ncbi:hypothetical protein EG68_01279 [Paragonimus skrjabini miyazakii]|uniref:Uncharacterized protein n=1 Tax=Paragonimus skrjabini miyazakii TaxID=59628 RepID=A0A8S9Z772_9TREM|nr:hypothetical protein EG68_01279 [Paragonimus skrjabini miyazakii]